METTQQYFFDGVVRASFLWENPNHAAVVFACAIPLLWIADRFGGTARGYRWIRYVAWLLEAMLFSMLVLTYSRSGILAWAAAAVCFTLMSVRDPTSPFVPWRFWLLRATTVLALVGGLGLSRRLASVATGDPSAVNRIELWFGGMQLIAANPWDGWGKGESGLAFMHWVQDPTSNAVCRGMVNSYLNFAVEFGMLSLFVCLVFILIPIVVGCASLSTQPPNRRLALTGCCCGLVAFFVAGVFNTLWIHWSVLWMPAILLVTVAGLSVAHTSKSTFVSGSLRAIAGAFAACALLFAGCLKTASVSRWRITKLSDGGVRFDNKTGPLSKNVVTFFPDGRTLGKHYGKAIREAVLPVADRISAFIVYPPGTHPKTAPIGTVLAFGARAGSGDVDLLETGCLVVCPAGFPPAKGSSLRTGHGRILIPGVDEIGLAQRWVDWAAQNQINAIVLPGVGQDVRSLFPAFMRSVVLNQHYQ